MFCPCMTLAAEKQTLDAAWEKASSFLFNESFKTFEKVSPENVAEAREREFGLAVTLLNVQPRTQSNRTEAKALLEKLISENSNDETGIIACYLLGRFHEFHESPPRLDDARKMYRQLAEQHVGHVVAEQAVAALVMLELYENVSEAERLKRFEALDMWSGKLQTRLGRRQFHMNMGLAAVTFRMGGERAIRHLIAADREGITRWQSEVIVWLAIGELAALEGNKDLALTYYRKFLEKYKRDSRNYMIREKVQALEAGAQPR